MKSYFEAQKILNMTIGYFADGECGTEEVGLLLLEQWPSASSFEQSLGDERQKLLDQLFEGEKEVVTHPESKLGFTIVNILAGQRLDSGDEGNGSGVGALTLAINFLLFLLL